MLLERKARVQFASLQLHEISIEPNPDGNGSAIVPTLGCLGIEMELSGPNLMIAVLSIAKARRALGQLGRGFPSAEALAALVKSQHRPEPLMARGMAHAGST
ncbi:MAG: hypothetical protein LBM75_03045 [Myxococcales bacterium]|nr:hypothetical protein [Myxococcales bacterium]